MGEGRRVTRRLPRRMCCAMRALLAGSCMCGSVAYEVDPPAGPIIHCHCQTCRKAHATAFSSVSAVPRDKSRSTKGEELLVGDGSSRGKFRRFARNAVRIFLLNA